MEVGLIARQTSFWQPDIIIPSREIIRIGDEAEQVVSRLFETHGVEEFFYTQYNPDSTIYPIDEFQPYWWSSWLGINSIRRLSEQIFRRSSEIDQVEGETIVVCNILGIGSQVKVKGGVRYMRMLDFEFRDPGDDVGIDEIVDIGLPRGTILKTDDSFHYYGLDLIGEVEWRDWIGRLIGLENSVELFGWSYLKSCLEHGYSALRIYGYKNTSKERTPVVVAKI